MFRRMTNGLGMGGAYGATMDRIQGQDGDRGKFGMEVLMWVSRSGRPLGSEELCHALGIEEDSKEVDPENVPAIEKFLSCCLGLVTVDEKKSRVRLIHLTLHEYLGGRPDLLSSAHTKMADICLTDLNLQSIKNLPPTLQKPPETAPFLHYASCYWGVHAGKESTERTKTLALQLLYQYDHHVAARMLLVGQGFSYRLPGIRNRGTDGLHTIACFRVAEIATAMIKSGGCERDRRDSRGYTPLLWAAEKNNREVCDVLLEFRGADPKLRDVNGWTPLFLASIVKLLLERKEVNPNPYDNDGNTPLSLATEEGHKGIVKLLQGGLSTDSKSLEARDEEAGSPAHSLLDGTPAAGTIPSSFNGDDPKPQPHLQETISIDPLNVSQNDHDNAMNAPNVSPNYFRLACVSLMFFCLISCFVLKSCLVLGLFLFFLVFL